MTEKANGSGFVKFALGATLALLTMGVGGAIATYAKVASMESTVAEINKRMDRIEDKVDQYLREHGK